jgi:hypothetical protein
MRMDPYRIDLAILSVVDPHHIDADPDSSYHPDGDPDADSNFYLMRIRIRMGMQVIEMIGSGSTTLVSWIGYGFGSVLVMWIRIQEVFVGIFFYLQYNTLQAHFSCKNSTFCDFKV